MVGGTAQMVADGAMAVLNYCSTGSLQESTGAGRFSVPNRFDQLEQHQLTMRFISSSVKKI